MKSLFFSLFIFIVLISNSVVAIGHCSISVSTIVNRPTNLCSTNSIPQQLDTSLETPLITDIEVTKQIIGNKVRAINSTISYKVVVKNMGNVAVTNVVIKDSIDVGLRLRSSLATKGQLINGIWNIPRIAIGDSAVLGVTTTVVAEGISFTTAYLQSIDQPDENENNNSATTCLSVPIRLCTDQVLDTSIPSNFTNVVWYRNGETFATGNNIVIKESGSYTYSASNNSCPSNGCCPIEVVIADCCPTQICIPITATKKKKNTP